MPSVDLNKVIKEPRYADIVVNAAKTDNHIRLAQLYMMAVFIGIVTIAVFIVLLVSPDAQTKTWAQNVCTSIVSAILGYGVGHHRSQKMSDSAPD